VGGFVHSLRFKVTAGVILILAAAMGVVFALQYRWFQHEMIERLGLSSTPLSDVIKGSLTHGMQSRNLAEIDAILENVSRQPGVIKVFVVDKRGEIRFSPLQAEVGRRVPLGDPTCQICHRLQPENRNKTVIFTVAGGARVFRNVNPIANEPACFGCHDPRSKINGVLISDFSMAEIDRQLAGKFREMLLTLLLTVGAAALTIMLTMNRLVIGKLERFVEATRLLGQGRLDLQVNVAPRDEIGQLATSFNRMVDGLRRARELRERHELLENVLNHIDDAVVVFAPDRMVVAFNRGSESAFGLSAAEVLGKAPALLGDDHEGLLARALAGGPFTVERELVRGDGRTFPARVHLMPLRSEKDEHLAWLAVAQDLTEERSKQRLQEQLAHTEKLAAVGRLAAGVAHELNNPLGNVLLYAKLLLEDLAPSADGYANARHIVDNTLRCKAIVQGLLEYARRSDARMAWTDLNELVEASVPLVENEFRRHGIRCQLDLTPGLPKVRCDGRQIQQLLVNLIQNGVEAIQGDGVVRIVTARPGERDAVILAVQDDGRGVPAEARSRVFEPFYTTKEQGTGLGLSICYGIVERHCGRIWLESRCEGPVRGSTFFVELPLTPARAS